VVNRTTIHQAGGFPLRRTELWYASGVMSLFVMVQARMHFGDTNVLLTNALLHGLLVGQTISYHSQVTYSLYASFRVALDQDVTLYPLGPWYVLFAADANQQFHIEWLGKICCTTDKQGIEQVPRIVGMLLSSFTQPLAFTPDQTYRHMFHLSLCVQYHNACTLRCLLRLPFPFGRGYSTLISVGIKGTATCS